MHISDYIGILQTPDLRAYTRGHSPLLQLSTRCAIQYDYFLSDPVLQWHLLYHCLLYARIPTTAVTDFSGVRIKFSFIVTPIR